MSKGDRRFLTMLLGGGVLAWSIVFILMGNDTEAFIIANLSVAFWNMMIAAFAPFLPHYFFEEAKQ